MLITVNGAIRKPPTVEDCFQVRKALHSFAYSSSTPVAEREDAEHYARLKLHHWTITTFVRASELLAALREKNSAPA